MPKEDLPASFYVEQADGAMLATKAAIGPWNEAHQHGGPPTALMCRALECFGDEPEAFSLVRITVELLSPVSVTEPLHVQVDPVKLGRRAQRFVVRLRLSSGKEVATATALRLRRVPVSLPEPPRHPPRAPLPSPEGLPSMVLPFFSSEVAYHTAVELRVARGQWGAGPCAAWLRPRIPLVAGEPLTPIQGLAIIADAANGVAYVLDVDKYAFVNPDLTIALARDPVGGWFGIDAHAVAVPDGIGLNDCGLFDETGALGRVLQSLVIAPRIGLPNNAG